VRVDGLNALRCGEGRRTGPSARPNGQARRATTDEHRFTRIFRQKQKPESRNYTVLTTDGCTRIKKHEAILTFARAAPSVSIGVYPWLISGFCFLLLRRLPPFAPCALAHSLHMQSCDLLGCIAIAG
jgi:hypothetical protein